MSAITEDALTKLRKNFYANDRNILAQNVCSKIDPFEACLSRKALEETHHVYEFKVESEGKPVTNQRNSGRCWNFAALNVIRLPFMKSLNIDDFEFSQAYLFFWDKIERSNYFLNNIVETCRRNEVVDGRLVSFLLSDPVTDGGQWDMIVNLINKYGLMPKKCFPESFSCENTAKLNNMLRTKLREYAKAIRDLMTKGGTDADVQTLLQEQIKTIFRIVGICLGIPNEEFTFTYYDKNKNYHSIGPISPRNFYLEHVKPVFNIDDKVCLVTDPRPSHEYGKCYTLDCLGNVVGGRQCIYNNQPVELLLELTGKSIKEGEAVWFGCEVSKRFVPKQGIMDPKAHNFHLMFGTDFQNVLSKADRLIYGDGAMTHAMIFTAASFNATGEVTKLRVENSWGEERGDKGYLLMSSEWFKEYLFEVVVDKRFVPQEVLEVFNQTPIVLPAWDPMGTLASVF